MDNNDNNKKQLNFDLRPEVAQGNYSNLAIISHSRSEFILDFAAALPGMKPDVRSRIIMTPEHCKRLLNALTENISRYEAQFGPICLGPSPEQKGTFNLADFAQHGTKS